jgi:hypothetical protein
MSSDLYAVLMSLTDRPDLIHCAQTRFPTEAVPITRSANLVVAILEADLRFASPPLQLFRLLSSDQRRPYPAQRDVRQHRTLIQPGQPRIPGTYMEQSLTLTLTSIH